MFIVSPGIWEALGACTRGIGAHTKSSQNFDNLFLPTCGEEEPPSQHTHRESPLTFSCGESPRRRRPCSLSSLESSASNSGDTDDGRPGSLSASPHPSTGRQLARVGSAAGSVSCEQREDTSALASSGSTLSREPLLIDTVMRLWAFLLAGDPPTQWGLLSYTAGDLYHPAPMQLFFPLSNACPFVSTSCHPAVGYGRGLERGWITSRCVWFTYC